MIGVAPEAFAGKLGGGFLQDPQLQQGQTLVFRFREAKRFPGGQDLFCQPQIDGAVRFLRVDSHILLRQHTKGMLWCVGDGKMVGTIFKIRLSPVRDQNLRQVLSGLLPVKLRQKLPPGFMAGLPIQDTVSQDHRASMILESPPSRYR